MPKSSRSGVIVQARQTSTRFPGKVLQFVGNRSVLGHVLTRSSLIEGVDVICCAVPEGIIHDQVAEEALKWNAVVVRGSEQDVLCRYIKAASALRLDNIIRITSDCPLIDPFVCAQVLDLMVNRAVDYACNNLPPTFPHGLDCEAFTIKALLLAHDRATSVYEREHVTPWLRNNSSVSRAVLSGPGYPAVDQRWTLDYKEDLLFFRELRRLFPDDFPLDYKRVLEAANSHPEICELNRDHRAGNRG